MIITPLIATIAILAVFLLIQLTVDMTRGRRTKIIHDRLLEIGKKEALKSISVVVRTKRSQQKLIDLLDHLSSFGYDKSQVVIVPSERKNKKFNEFIRSYRTLHPTMDIRVVRTPGRRDDATIASRHARGELILWMELSDRLSPRFFDLTSYEFADPSVERIDVPHRYAKARSLADVNATWSLIRAETFELLHLQSAKRRVAIYRRASFKQDSAPKTVKARTQLSVIRERTVVPVRSNLFTSLNLVVSIVLAYGAIVLLSGQWLFTTLAVITVYLLSNIIWLISSKRYTAPESALLILGLPFAIIGDFRSRG